MYAAPPWPTGTGCAPDAAASHDGRQTGPITARISLRDLAAAQARTSEMVLLRLKKGGRLFLKKQEAGGALRPAEALLLDVDHIFRHPAGFGAVSTSKRDGAAEGGEGSSEERR